MIYIAENREINPELTNTFSLLSRTWKELCFLQSSMSFYYLDSLVGINTNPEQLLSSENNDFKQELTDSIKYYNAVVNLQNQLSELFTKLTSHLNDSVTVKPYTSTSYMWIYHDDSKTFIPICLNNWPKTDDGAYLLGGFPSDYYFYIETWMNF